MPGVNTLPRPSMTSASCGALTVVPTAAILPSRSRTLPFRMVGPAAVMIVTSRINVARDAGATYVLGKGSALGADTAPAPGAGRPVSGRAAAVVAGVAGRGEVVGVTCAGAQATNTAPTSATNAAAGATACGVRMKRVSDLGERYGWLR